MDAGFFTIVPNRVKWEERRRKAAGPAAGWERPSDYGKRVCANGKQDLESGDGMHGRKELEALQLERLKALVDYCDRTVRFYHDRFAAAG